MYIVQCTMYNVCIYMYVYQDHEGRSPLHSAVFSHQLRSLVALLEAGTDPTVLNHRLFGPIHNAAMNAFLP